MARPLTRPLVALAVAFAVRLPGAHAQAVLGGFDDATVPRRGEARIRILGAFSTFTDRYGGSSTAPNDARVAIGARFSFDTLGAAQLPALARLQTALGAVTGGTPDPVSLGRVTAGARAATLTVPLAADLGLTRRLSLGIYLPVVRARQSLDLRVNADSATGNVGFNPADADAFGGAIGTEARNRNVLVQTQFRGAITALEGLLARCPTTAGDSIPAGCAAVVANRGGATALVTAAGAFARGVAQVYGDSAATGLRFVPVAGSPLQQQVQRRVAALSEQFRGFGVTDLATTTAPAGSPARIGIAGLQRIVVDPAFGVVADTLGSTLRSSTGDIDLTGTLLLVDTFGEGVARLTPTGVRIRATATAGFRFGFPQGVDIPFVFFDLPTATGANALLFRGAADVAFGRRAWATVAARFAAPLADEQTVRVTDAPDEPFPAAERERLVGRQLGREVELEVTPRYAFGHYLAVAAHYAFRGRTTTRYTGTFELEDGTTVDASVLDGGSATREQRAGVGITYSTVAAALRGQTRIPVEISYLHTESFAGSGGAPKLSTDVVQVRLYVRIFGRRRGAS